MAAIFVASSLPDLGPLPGDVSDKSAHSVAYAGLGVLVLYALARGRLEGVTWRRAVLAVAISILYGMSDEWHQSFVPGRTADWADVLADAVGAALGVTLVGAVIALRAWGILRVSARQRRAP
ncbi:MAG: VanZ family protein [Acidobacteria bacterium]|nr:VanZ family protein [Acidobacteriota bacterium]MBA3884479.1 VanZ family protein [Acidobacteriota bacterium]